MYRFAASTVWATDQGTRQVIADVLARHRLGIRLERGDIEALQRGGRDRPKPSRGAVAVVPLWGVLVPHAGMMVDVSTAGNGLDAWSAMFDEAVADPSVETVLIHVNSPGGSAVGVTEAAKKVRDARASKRIVAIADGLAASAAFAIATQADTLIVTPSGQVGAVHCYAIHEDISAALEREGITLTLVAAPDGGSAEAPSFLALSDENRAHMQETIDEYYGRFVDDVAKGRGVSAATVEANFGRGRVLTSTKALAAGMVDGIATFEDTLQRLLAGKQIAGGARQLDDKPELVAAVNPVATGGGASATVVVNVGAAGGTGGSSATAVTETSTTTSFDQPPAESQTTPPTADPAPAEPANHERGNTMEGTVTLDGRPPTLEELAAQQTRVSDRLAELNDHAAGRMFTGEEEVEFTDLNEKHDELEQTITQLKARNVRMSTIAKKRGGLSGDGASASEHTTEGITVLGDGRRGLPDDLFDLHAYRRFAASHEQLSTKLRDGALFINEKTPYASSKPERARDLVQRLISGEKDSDSRDSFTQRFFATANPEYEHQFSTWLRTGRETDRPKMAVSIGGLGNETPIPVTIDPTVILDSDGATSAIRRLARNITITGNVWRGIASQGVTITYEGELTPVDPQDPVFRSPEATVVKAQASVQFSIEVDQDWGSFRTELARMFADAKNVKEADAFLHGTGPGTNQPEGLVYALDVDDSSVVRSATANTLALADARSLVAALPPRFEENATWLASKAFYAQVNSLSRAESNFDIWVPFSQGFGAPMEGGSLRYQMLGYPTASGSEMSTLFTTGGENVAVLGDFGRGFAIIDRVGLNVELDPLVRDSNGKLIGARELYFYFRNTSKLLSPNAFRMLQIKST